MLNAKQNCSTEHQQISYSLQQSLNSKGEHNVSTASGLCQWSSSKVPFAFVRDQFAVSLVYSEFMDNTTLIYFHIPFDLYGETKCLWNKSLSTQILRVAKGMWLQNDTFRETIICRCSFSRFTSWPLLGYESMGAVLDFQTGQLNLFLHR